MHERSSIKSKTGTLFISMAYSVPVLLGLQLGRRLLSVCGCGLQTLFEV